VRALLWFAIFAAVAILVQASSAQDCGINTVVRVLDMHDQPVMDIAAESVKAEVDGRPARISSFAPSKPSLTLLLRRDRQTPWVLQKDSCCHRRSHQISIVWVKGFERDGRISICRPQRVCCYASVLTSEFENGKVKTRSHRIRRQNAQRRQAASCR
jgi:hypothetical protein